MTLHDFRINGNGFNWIWMASDSVLFLNDKNKIKYSMHEEWKPKPLGRKINRLTSKFWLRAIEIRYVYDDSAGDDEHLVFIACELNDLKNKYDNNDGWRESVHNFSFIRWENILLIDWKYIFISYANAPTENKCSNANEKSVMNGGRAWSPVVLQRRRQTLFEVVRPLECNFCCSCFA